MQFLAKMSPVCHPFICLNHQIQSTTFRRTVQWHQKQLLLQFVHGKHTNHSKTYPKDITSYLWVDECIVLFTASLFWDWVLQWWVQAPPKHPHSIHKNSLFTSDIKENGSIVNTFWESPRNLIILLKQNTPNGSTRSTLFSWYHVRLAKVIWIQTSSWKAPSMQCRALGWICLFTQLWLKWFQESR